MLSCTSLLPIFTSSFSNSLFNICLNFSIFSPKINALAFSWLIVVLLSIAKVFLLRQKNKNIFRINSQFFYLLLFFDSIYKPKFLLFYFFHKILFDNLLSRNFEYCSFHLISFFASFFIGCKFYKFNFLPYFDVSFTNVYKNIFTPQPLI